MKPMRTFFSRWQNWPGAILVLLFIAVAVLAPELSPEDPAFPGPFKKLGQTRDIGLIPPGDTAVLGTMPSGYDVYHSLIWGARNAIKFGLTVTVFSGLFGLLYGAVAAYVGSVVNRVMMRIADAFLCFPVIAGVVFLQQLQAIAVEAGGGMYIFGQTAGNPAVGVPLSEAPIQVLLNSINPVMLSLILFSWMPYARVVNTIILGLKGTDFVLAARAVGASSWRIVWRHLIPNSLAPALVLAARDMGSVVIFQATLTFIRIGGDSPWGEMLAIGRNWVIGPGGRLFEYWWLYIPATLAVILFGVSWNMVGDGITDVLDPYHIRK